LVSWPHSIDFSTTESVLELRPIADPELGHVTHEDVKKS